MMIGWYHVVAGEDVHDEQGLLQGGGGHLQCQQVWTDGRPLKEGPRRGQVKEVGDSSSANKFVQMAYL